MIWCWVTGCKIRLKPPVKMSNQTSLIIIQPPYHFFKCGSLTALVTWCRICHTYIDTLKDTHTKTHTLCAKTEGQAYSRNSSAVVIPSKHYLFNTLAHISVWLIVAYMRNIRGLFINFVCRHPGLKDDILEEFNKETERHDSLFALWLAFCVVCVFDVNSDSDDRD